MHPDQRRADYEELEAALLNHEEDAQLLSERYPSIGRLFVDLIGSVHDAVKLARSELN